MPHPERLGRYDIFETLAAGRMGKIYKGFDRASGRTVVLKTIPRERLEQYGSAAVSRLQNQARAAAGLHHPGIVEIYEYGEDAGLAFIAMEYVSGCGIREQTRLPIPDAASLIMQLLKALDYAHDQGVVHRDIKPSNLLLMANGQLRISDFGIARLEPGSPNYMSPEQLMDSPADRRSDIFSSGVVFYELLTGRAPFADPNRTLVHAVCNQEQKPPSSIDSSVPAVFDAVCAKALAKVPVDRFPTARAFSDAVAGALMSSAGGLIPKLVSAEAVALLSARPAAASSSSDAPRPDNAAPFTWDSETLRNVEKQLATFVGPLARIIVRDAAARTSDLDRLYSLVSERLGNEDQRKAFLALRPGPGARPADAPPPPKVETPRPSPPPPPVAKPEQPSAARPEIKSEPPKQAVPPPAPSTPKTPPQPVAKPIAFPLPVSKPTPEPKATPIPEPVSAIPEAKPTPPKSAVDSLLDDQPANLAACLKDAPAQVEYVIHGFANTVDALAALYVSTPGNVALTPENIRFNRNGTVSFLVSQGTGTQGSGIIVGKPRYAPPEIFAEKKGTTGVNSVAASHVYALGFMFYEVLLGRKLFEKTFSSQHVDLEWLSWHADLEKKAPPLKTLLPDCAVALSDLIESMIEKRMEKRATDLKAIRTGLAAVAQRSNRTVVLRRAPAADKPKPAAGHSAAPKKQQSNSLFILIMILVLLAGIGGLLWQDPALIQKITSLFHHATQ